MYNHRMTPRRTGFLLLAASVCAVAGCAAREVEKDLKVVDVRTGWYDMGIVDGQNKLVPSVSLKLENVSADGIGDVEFQGIFRRVDEDKTWGDHYIRAIGRDGLPPGATTGAIVLRSQRGYTGSEARLKMLENKDFVDAKVTVFGKHGSRQWVRMGEFPIERQLLTE
jgi:hypothetical protein